MKFKTFLSDSGFGDCIFGKNQHLDRMKGSIKWLWLMVGVLTLTGITMHAAPLKPGDKVENFALLDQNGRIHELRRPSDAKVIVLFSAGNGCPIVRQSFSKLNELRHQFADQQVVFWLLNANSQDDVDAIRKESFRYQVQLPVLKDDTQFIARGLGIERTAEAIAINTKDWTILYRGAIDDQLKEGAKKPQPTEHYLANALKEFFAGKEVVQKTTSVSGCLISYDDAVVAEKDAPTYVKDVAPILQNKCVSCHSTGNIGPFAMSNYKKVKGWSEMIREVVLTKRMPPWHADPHFGTFSNDRSLTLAETQTLLSWIENGSPRGEGEDLLEKYEAPVNDWALGKPDYIVQPSREMKVQANGVMDYIYDYVEAPVTNDVWLKAAVIRPDNRKVVHHVIIYMIFPKEHQGKYGREDRWLVGWAPGAEMMPYPEGTGRFLPKGTKLKFELHYNTIGREEVDRSELGLYLMKEPPAQEIEMFAVRNQDFTIPPGEPDARTFAMEAFHNDVLIWDLSPHMHLRGSWFRYEALYPDGTSEVLLSVPRYDFNWQTTYQLKQPKRVPAGTRILCTGGFDNSATNPFNPDPSKRVRDGRQSFEEMFIGFMEVVHLPKPVVDKRQASLTNP